MKAPILAEATDMHEKESFKRVMEGLALSLSCAREMQSIDPNGGWGEMVKVIKGVMTGGKKLFMKKPMTRQVLVNDAWRIQSKLGPVAEN